MVLKETRDPWRPHQIQTMRDMIDDDINDSGKVDFLAIQKEIGHTVNSIQNMCYKLGIQFKDSNSQPKMEPIFKPRNINMRSMPDHLSGRKVNYDR